MRREPVRRGRANRERGRRGEDRALAFLTAAGYRILAQGFRTRRGEVDVIAMADEVICFVEIKTVAPGDPGVDGGERLIFAQRRRMAFAALEYLTRHGLSDCEARMDLVTVTGPEGAQSCELTRDIFGLDDVLEDRYR